MAQEISKEELKKKMENDSLHLIEVLKPESFEKYHIKGAINIPLERIVTEAKDQFEKDEEIVVYCSDYECTSSPTAAKKLEQSGFTNVYHYAGGKKEWKEAGLPTEGKE